MSERLKRSVGAICICCNIHDRGIRTMSDPDWMEVIGHPSIPHVQSLRAPPAQVAHHPNKENLIGLTNRNASKRYLEKLQKEREKNQEVLAECVDNLPIVIRQMVYPEKPSPKQPWRIGTGNSAKSGERKYRVGKHPPDNFWHENIEHWVQSEHPNHAEDSSRQQQQSHNRNGNQKNDPTAHERKHTCPSDQSETTDSVVLSKEFVHHQGFQGSPESQSTTLKYKFGKKKATPSKETNNQPNTFKPKGFGSLYDELEFERRYKKVFDLNKHIHFVHSNYISGQRLYKRNKLPPIGHIPSVQSDPTDSRDIFAIMSVQRFNHPDEIDVSRAPADHPHAADGIPRRHQVKRNIEISQNISVPLGFIPGTIKSTGNSPFDGVNGNIMQKDGTYRLSMSSIEGDSARGTLTEDSSRPVGGDDFAYSERSEKSFKSKRSKLSANDDVNSKDIQKNRVSHKEDRVKIKSRSTINDERPTTGHESTLDEQEPFNISVRVEIKPKDPNMNGGDDVENERARERRLPIIELAESPVNDGLSEHNEHDHDSTDKVLYPTKIENELSPRSESTDDGSKVLTPKHITITANQFGIVSHKVQYPDRFVLRESLVEEDENEDESETGNNKQVQNKTGQNAKC